MKIAFLIVLILICSLGQSQTIENDSTVKTRFNQSLIIELDSMAKLDQLAAWNAFPPEGYEDFSQDKWNAFKDSIYRTHQSRLAEIFERYGYPGFDLVGKKGETNFWVMVQHSDFDPDFQYRVLEKLKIEVDNKKADSRHYALLLDRVNLYTNKEQIYGTQVTYNDFGQAYPRDLYDSLGVDKRRHEVGLDPLIDYLNRMTTMHFEMNKDNLREKGILEPMIYKKIEN